MPSRLGPARLARRLGARIRALRNEAGITQEGAAWESEVSKAHLSQIESGRGYPSVPVLALLAKRLGVTLVDLAACDPDDPRGELLDAVRHGDRAAAEKALDRLGIPAAGSKGRKSAGRPKST